MAPPPQESKLDDASDWGADWSRTADRRAAELKRMRLWAIGLLILMLAVFIATNLAMGMWPDLAPALAYVRAFSEAAMVGAIADWFAVVALFRHPFGIPIPHTAIIARNKDRIGDSLGAFICNNFLAPEVVSAKLDHLDVAGKAADWLSRPANAAMLSRRLAGTLPAILDGLEETEIRVFLRSALRHGIASVEAAPLASRVLGVLAAHGHHQVVFDHLVANAERFLLANQDHIRLKVADRSYRWLPNWVDRKLADKVVLGLAETLSEMRHPGHPWRSEFQAFVDGTIQRLATDPDWRLRGEAIKAELMGNPAVDEYLDTLWSELKTRLRADMASDDGILRQGLEAALLGLGARLAEDDRLRALLNRWLRRAIERHAVPQRGRIGAFIAGIVARWDTPTLVNKLELQVGKDLQYIRINGTLVGGLAGVIIYSVAHALGW